TGMEAPRGLGTVYTTKFGAMFPELAEKYDTLLYPFFLEGVALERDLNLADGIHPNAKGVAVIVGRIRPAVDALIERVQQQRRRTASDS
ncbi:MAG: arylesterase, partial [Pseudomonadota bacterium]